MTNVGVKLTSTQLERSKLRIDSLGISAATLATICDIRPATLSNALRGIRALDSDVEYRLATTSLLLVEIAEAARPLLLPNDPQSLVPLLEFVKLHGITPDAIRTAISSVFGASD